MSELELAKVGEPVKVEQPAKSLSQPQRILTGEPQREILPKMRIPRSLSPVLADEDCTSKVTMWKVREDKMPNLSGKSRHLKLFHIKSLFSSQAATCFLFNVHGELPDEDDFSSQLYIVLCCSIK